jgi:hypothetical protein
MTSLLTPQEVHGAALAGSISRAGAFVSTRTLNQAAGVAEGLLLAPSGTAGQECISPTTEALVRTAIGFSVFRPMSEDFDSTHHYADNEAVALMESGHMHVLCEGTCVADKPVYVRITSDGGSNTVLGKVRADQDYAAGLVLTPTASPVAGLGAYLVRLIDAAGNDETFVYPSDGTTTVAEIAAGLVALIDASPNFVATGTVTVTVTAAAGAVVEILQLGEHLTVTAGPRCIRVPGCFFDASRTGAGLVEIRRNKIN